ncbi:MAG: OB-fold nucleic acid binding domain-containing protein [Clostridium sp.]|nr:MAG: OB-fold nucleic acid binding domain-containing protein [Clostridium sp.]
MANKYRNIYCGEVTKEYENKEVRVAGWIENVRNLGSLVFIALRDETGIVQLISENTEYSRLNRESTVTVLGKVVSRTPEMVNKNMKTGEIEIEIKELEVLGDVYKNASIRS